MTEKSERGVNLKTIESQIESLATSAMAGTQDSEVLLTKFQNILRELVDSSPAPICEAATELIAGLDQTAGRDTGWIADGLIQLQAAIQQAESGNLAPVSLAQDPELVGDFIMEARDHLATAESHLLVMEKGGDQGEAIHAIFRAYHTIKGLAGFLELREMREVSHEVETLLDYVRNGQRAMSPAVIDAVLAGTDFLRQWLQHLECPAGATVPVGLSDTSEYVARLQALSPNFTGSENAESEGPLQSAEVPSAEAPCAGESPKHGRARSVKVDTEKLDYLVDMVGEMVIAQSMVRHDPSLAKVQTSKLTRNMAQLARITDEVQRTAMAMRMVPLGPTFQRMSRLVRDLGRKSGKQAVLEITGEDVELDRNIVEELADPLMHMIRNSMDHGVESLSARVAAGKQATAKIELKALHLAGQIVIQVCDDGRGLDHERILAKARQRGLVSEGAILSENDIIKLIFEPGFSTAEAVTDISGRGVGMDVVRKQIQKLRGAIEVQSTAGQGTRFALRLPLTMAIIDGLVVGVGNERYIIPIFSVKEMLRPSPAMLSKIEGTAEVVLVRNRLMPVIRLYERFGIEPKVRNPAEGVLVIADNDGKPFCLMVDEVLGKQEVVIKNLGRVFQEVAGVAGGAILGDGHVGLILDLKRVFA